MPPAISITLYDKNDEVIKTYERKIIPWGLLKKASRLMDQAEGETEPKKKKWFRFWQTEDTNVRAEERQADAVSDFVVELFNDQFTRKQLEDGADMGEIMTVFQSVITRANAVVKSNPTMRQSLKKR